MFMLGCLLEAEKQTYFFRLSVVVGIIVLDVVLVVVRVVVLVVVLVRGVVVLVKKGQHLKQSKITPEGHPSKLGSGSLTKFFMKDSCLAYSSYLSL